MDFGIVILLTIGGICLCLAIGWLTGLTGKAGRAMELCQQLAEEQHIGNALGDENEALKARIAALETDRKWFNDQWSKAASNLSECECELLEAKGNLDEYASQITELNTVIQEKTERCTKLEQDLLKEIADRRYQENQGETLSRQLLSWMEKCNTLQQVLAERDAVIKGLQDAHQPSPEQPEQWHEEDESVDIASVEDEIASKLEKYLYSLGDVRPSKIVCVTAVAFDEEASHDPA